MAKFLKLVIAAAIVYFAVTKGWPWLQTWLGGLFSSASGTTYQSICITATERASDDFTDRLRQFSSPPIDAEAWEKTVTASRNQVEAAERKCRNCDHEACLEASKAIAELERMVTWFDDSVQAGRGIPPDGVSRLDRVYEALNRARALQ